MPADLVYVLLLFLLLVLPKALQRFRMPAAISALLLGLLATATGWLHIDETTVSLLATLGIVALFLFAGLEVEFSELRRGARLLGVHLALYAGVLVLATWAFRGLLGLPTRMGVLLALAVFTPSTGFILDTLGSFGLDADQRFWVKSKAIAVELLALLVLFFALQSASWRQLGLSTLALSALVVAIPLALQVIAKKIVPFAPKSEFAFLVMVAVVCAYATKKLGVYYLVGAFLVGVAAQRFRAHLPALSSEKMLTAVEAFASLFVPFYFFHAGMDIHLSDFGWRAILTGLLLLVVCLPIRVGMVTLHRWLALEEPPARSARVGLSLTPTLVFSLVIAGILRERFELSPTLFGGVVLYTLVNTLLPGLILRKRDPSLEVAVAPAAEVHALPAHAPVAEAPAPRALPEP